ncbi:PilN domain-containing protein [Methylophilus sp. 5]|uniref:PilN domain-containing protein n=1 Tax=Methylophilus sp. 5 TaxID=1112274 RepID=UPI00048AAEE6|nr:PilN domain-containing protein [Methylophilus sp. 5]
MSQQINLFDGGLVKSKDWFTLPVVAAIYVLAAGVMFYLFTGLQAENAQLQTQRNQAVTQYETTQKKVDQFAQHVTPIDNSKLEATLKSLNARFEMQSQILAIFQQSISGAANHLVDYMRALTAQQQPGLWLTGFNIEPGAQHVTLSGQALQSEDIPLYLDLLSTQRIFEGTQFSGIQFKQVELHRAQAAASATPAPTPVPPPAPVVEAPAGKGATEASASAGAAPGVPASPAAAPSAPAAEVTLQVYAFEVKGKDLQNKAKRENTVSWDEFVRQTTQSPAKQP